MTPDEILSALAKAEGLPRAAMLAAAERRDEVVPLLLKVLHDYADGTDRSEPAANIVFFGTHLLAQFGESRAFPLLARILALPPGDMAPALGETTTATLPKILISTYDDDLATLCRLIETGSADDLARFDAIKAFAWLVQAGRIPGDSGRDVLMGWFDRLTPRATHVVWLGWSDAVALLALDALAPQARALYARGWIDPVASDVEEFDAALRDAVEHPEGQGRFLALDLEPLGDAVAELERWSHADGDPDDWPGDDWDDTGDADWDDESRDGR